MPAPDAPVVRNRASVTEERFQDLLVAGLARVKARVGAAALASSMNRSTRQLDNVFSGSTPGPKALFDALDADATALDEVLAAYGFKLEPLETAASADLPTIVALGHANAEWIERLGDGQRCHIDTLAIADRLRPLMPHLNGLLNEADRIKGNA